MNAQLGDKRCGLEKFCSNIFQILTQSKAGAPINQRKKNQLIISIGQIAKVSDSNSLHFFFFKTCENDLGSNMRIRFLQ